MTNLQSLQVDCVYEAQSNQVSFRVRPGAGALIDIALPEELHNQFALATPANSFCLALRLITPDGTVTDSPSADDCPKFDCQETITKIPPSLTDAGASRPLAKEQGQKPVVQFAIGRHDARKSRWTWLQAKTWQSNRDGAWVSANISSDEHARLIACIVESGAPLPAVEPKDHEPSQDEVDTPQDTATQNPASQEQIAPPSTPITEKRTTDKKPVWNRPVTWVLVPLLLACLGAGGYWGLKIFDTPATPQVQPAPPRNRIGSDTCTSAKLNGVRVLQINQAGTNVELLKEPGVSGVNNLLSDCQINSVEGVQVDKSNTVVMLHVKRAGADNLLLFDTANSKHIFIPFKDLGESVSFSNMSLAPDGKSLLFVSSKNGAPSLCFYDSPLSSRVFREVRLEINFSEIRRPCFMANGTSVVFIGLPMTGQQHKSVYLITNAFSSVPQCSRLLTGDSSFTPVHLAASRCNLAVACTDTEGRTTLSTLNGSGALTTPLEGRLPTFSTKGKRLFCVKDGKTIFYRYANLRFASDAQPFEYTLSRNTPGEFVFLDE